jgi:hypothetical protein
LGTVAAATACGAAVAPEAGAFDRGYIWMGVVSKGPVRGLTLLQQTDEHRARGTVALVPGGIGEGASDTVAWSTKPCSKTVASPAAKGGGEVAIESLDLAHEGLSFARRSLPLSGSVESGRSIRVWGGRKQLACTGGMTNERATIATAVFRGRVKGIFAAVQRRGARIVRGYTALPDLDANANYRMAGSRRSCSKADTSRSRTFSLALKRPGGFATQVIEHLEDLVGVPGTASVRLLRSVPGGTATQVACAITAVYSGDTN